MKKAPLFYGLMFVAMVMVATSCRFQFSFSFGKKSPTVDYFSVYTVWDGEALKLDNIRVYSVSEKRYTYLRRAIDGKTLFVDISWKDYLENIRSLTSVLTKPEYAEQNDVKIIIVLSQFERMQAEIFKQTFKIPFEIYLTDIRARRKPFQVGPKLFITNDKYELRNKYIHQSNQPEKTREYLDMVLKSRSQF